MAIKGYLGSVKAGALNVGTAKAWSLDISADNTDTTTFGDAGWKTNVQTLKGWSGSITCVFDAGNDTGEAAVIASLTAGTVVALTLLTGAIGAGTAETYAGDAHVTGMPVASEVSGIMEVTFSFTGTGELTLAGVV